MRTNSRSGWRKFSGLALIVVALCLSKSSVALAQTQEPSKPAPDVEQLKQRVLQLEQRVLELRGQNKAIE